MSEQPERLNEPDEFSRELVATLDRSLDGQEGSPHGLDDLTLQRLKVARVKALQQSRTGRFNKKIIPAVAAAAIAAVLLVPVFWHQQGVDGIDTDEVAALEIPPSAQELDDLDMLIALEDEDA